MAETIEYNAKSVHKDGQGENKDLTYMTEQIADINIMLSDTERAFKDMAA